MEQALTRAGQHPQGGASEPCLKGSSSTPAVLTDERDIAGFRQPQWVARELQPGERIAVEHALIEIEQRFKPIARDALRALWARLANHFRNERTPQEIRVLFDDYATDLSEFSEAHVDEAMQEHRRTKTWFPKIAELRALAAVFAARDRVLRHRARVLLGLEEPSSWERPRPAPEPAFADEQFGARPLLEAEIAKLPPALAESVRSLYAARQQRLGRPGPLFGRRSA